MTDTADEELDPPSGEIGKTKNRSPTNDKRKESTGYSTGPRWRFKLDKWGIHLSGEGTKLTNGLTMALIGLTWCASLGILVLVGCGLKWLFSF